MRHKPFPHYDELSIVFGRDRVTGDDCETPIDQATEINDHVEDVRLGSQVNELLENRGS